MSVARAREVNARLRAMGITVHEWEGWESRGNGQTSAYEGGIVHHTASPYGFAYPTLVYGRPDLAGPLCNYAGNEDGSLTVVAAHPANHAGASGGPSMGPLPTTTLFNRRVMGLEIVYPGTSPMRPAQYRAACAWSKVITDVTGWGDIERARAHAETSVTGKWDPGYALYRTIDMRRFRADAAQILQEDDMAVSDAEKAELLAGARSVVFGLTDVRPAGDLALAVYRVETKLDALAGALSNTEARIVAATRQIVADDPDAEVSQAQIDQLVAALRDGLPSVTPEQIETSLRRVFADAAS